MSENNNVRKCPKMSENVRKCPKMSCFQVVNAARILAARPSSKVAQDNMEVFKEAWINQVLCFAFLKKLPP
jgi:hypothetical protein